MSDSLETGTKLGRYEIRSKIGAGGMGEVYLAHDPELDRTVAIKILPQDVAADNEGLQRFLREARAASALNHPHILTIYEIGNTGKSRFIATEFIDGTTLRERLKAGMRMSEVLEVSIQAASALVAAHRAGIIHRDIKPDNIMIRRDGYAKLLDFGLAKLTLPIGSSSAEAQTQAMMHTGVGKVLGTISYMSPEQAKGVEVDARTDLWSLGVVIYEMVTDHLPFTGETPTETISLIIQRDFEPISTYFSATPQLEKILSKALTKNLDARYQTADEMLRDLRQLKVQLDFSSEINSTEAPSAPSPRAAATQGLPAETTTDALAQGSVTTAENIFSSVGRHRIAIAIGCLLLILGVAAAYLKWRRGPAAIQSIAVLPFENHNQDPETDYLSDGVTESIINSLAQLPNVKVIGRSSAFRYKGKQSDPEKAGRELGVQVVLTGRLIQRGDNLTISTELLDVRENKQIWGEQYTEKISDILAMQRNIAGQISNHLRLKLTGAEQSRVTRHYTESAEAYQLYLKGRFLWNKRTNESLAKALEYFNQAIEKDPTYALAYAGLADTWFSRGWYRHVEPKDAYERAKAAANKALEIDDKLAEAHAILAAIKTTYDWDWQGAEREFKLAIQLNPNYATAHQRYSLFLPALGRMDEAIDQARRAREIDPLSLPINENLGDVLYLARRYEPAIEQLRKTLELDPNYGVAHSTLSKVYEAQKRYDESLNERMFGSPPELVSELKQIYATSGIKGVWKNRLDALLDRSKTNYVSPADIALFYTRLNDRDQAFAWLEKGMAERSINFNYLVADPRFDNLRGDPRLAELLRRVGLQPIKN